MKFSIPRQHCLVSVADYLQIVTKGTNYSRMVLFNCLVIPEFCLPKYINCFATDNPRWATSALMGPGSSPSTTAVEFFDRRDTRRLFPTNAGPTEDYSYGYFPGNSADYFPE